MIYHIDEPRLLLAEGLALLVAIVLHGVAQAWAAWWLGDRQAGARRVPDPRRHFEPFGVIAAVISALSWVRPVPLQEWTARRRRGRYLMSLAAGPLMNLLVAFACLVAARMIHRPDAGLIAQVTNLRALPAVAGAPLPALLLGVGAAINVHVAALSLFPLPPLDGARAMWVLAPASESWRRARYQLEERNFGPAILLVLLLLPILGQVPLGLQLVTKLSAPLLRAVSRLAGLGI